METGLGGDLAGPLPLVGHWYSYGCPVMGRSVESSLTVRRGNAGPDVVYAGRTGCGGGNEGSGGSWVYMGARSGGGPLTVPPGGRVRYVACDPGG
jgi:hypothetical protein